MRAVFLAALLLLAECMVGQAQDSLGMRRVSGLDYWKQADDIQMVGNLAYIVSGSSGLHVIDLSDAAHPTEIGRYTWYELDDIISGVFVTGNLAYATAGYSVFVFDISDPTHPVKLGEWLEGRMGDIFVYGDIGIGIGESGCPFVLDVHDPTNIHRVGEFPGITFLPYPIGMVGNYLFMTVRGLEVWDMSNPALPVKVATADTLMPTHCGTLLGNYAYLATYHHGLRIMDVSNPLLPVEVAACDSGECFNVTVTDSHAVVLKSYGLDLWNITDPTQPVFEGTLTSLPEWYYSKMSSSNDRVCFAVFGRDTAAVVVDISNPTAPFIAGSIGHVGSPHHFVINGTIGYLAENWQGLRMINLADPAHPTELGSINTSFDNVDVAVMGNYAYLTDYNRGVAIYDVSDPAQPESLSCWNPGGTSNANTIVINGEYAYVNGLYWILSLQDPTSPQLIDSVTIYGAGGYPEISNGYLYIGAQSTASQIWFRIFNVADPSTPQLAGSCGLSGHAFADGVGKIAVIGRYAYVSGPLSGMWTVDVSDPAHPFEVAWNGGCAVRILAASGNTLFTGGPCGDINVLDVTDPLHPNVVGYYPTDEVIREMRIQGQYLITISMNLFSIYQVDALTDAADPSILQPTSFTLSVFPNPFNPTTTISFTLPRAAQVKLAVYDVLGRMVGDYMGSVQQAGEHHITFDGTELSSGIYFVRLEAGTQVEMRKMILLR